MTYNGTLELHQYHDSELIEVRFKWNLGTIELGLKTGDGEKTITLINVREANIPKRNPWGRSNYINEVHYEEQMLKIEMQSGDVIQIEGEINQN